MFSAGNNTGLSINLASPETCRLNIKMLPPSEPKNEASKEPA
jgi:hypothetical protein